MHSDSLLLTLCIPCQGLNSAVIMADNGKTNESEAAAEQQANGDQQVRSTVTQNDMVQNWSILQTNLTLSSFISYCGDQSLSLTECSESVHRKM